MAMYDEAWAESFEKLAEAAIPGREGLFRLCAACLAPLPEQANVLVVGCGVGAELLYLARRFPSWHFEAIDPAEPMLTGCRQRLAAAGLTDRVTLQCCTLAEFKSTTLFNAVTAILVSQHLVADTAAEKFFHQLAALLTPGGYLYSADLHVAKGQDRELMIETWQQQAAFSGIAREQSSTLLARFGQDLVARDEAVIEEFIQKAGFEHMVKPFSSLLYGSWTARKKR